MSARPTDQLYVVDSNDTLTNNTVTADTPPVGAPTDQATRDIGARKDFLPVGTSLKELAAGVQASH